MIDFNTNISTQEYLNAIREELQAKQTEANPKEQADNVIQTEVIKGSVGMQKEVLTLLSTNQQDLSNREAAQKQLRNGYLDITI